MSNAGIHKSKGKKRSWAPWVLSGGLLGLAAALSQCDKEEQYPAISIAFNGGNSSFARLSNSYSTAEERALTACRTQSRFDGRNCHIKARVEAGTQMCVDYGAVAHVERYMTFNNEPDYRITRTDYFVDFTIDQSQPNLARQACLESGRYTNDECGDQYFDRTCNFTAQP